MIVRASDGKEWRKKIPDTSVIDISFAHRIPRIKNKATNANNPDIDLEGFKPLVHDIASVRIEAL